MALRPTPIWYPQEPVAMFNDPENLPLKIDPVTQIWIGFSLALGQKTKVGDYILASSEETGCAYWVGYEGKTTFAAINADLRCRGVDTSNIHFLTKAPIGSAGWGNRFAPDGMPHNGVFRIVANKHPELKEEKTADPPPNKHPEYKEEKAADLPPPYKSKSGIRRFLAAGCWR